MLKKINTSLLEMAYEEKGDANGKPVILMHGFPDDARTWNPITDRLAAEGFRTLAIDTRGYGATRFRDDATMRSGEGAAYAYERRAFENVGHFLPREHPEAVTEAVLDLS